MKRLTDEQLVDKMLDNETVLIDTDYNDPDTYFDDEDEDEE